MLSLVSSAVLGIVLFGLILRKRRGVHICSMVIAFCLDLSLVLYIELTREAVEKVATSVHPFVWIHASISTAVLILYGVQLMLGLGLLNGEESRRRGHRYAGAVFVVLRLANYLTSLFVGEFI